MIKKCASRLILVLFLDRLLSQLEVDVSGWRAQSLGCKADKFTSGGCSVCEPASGEKRPFLVASGANDTSQHLLSCITKWQTNERSFKNWANTRKHKAVSKSKYSIFLELGSELVFISHFSVIWV